MVVYVREDSPACINDYVEREIDDHRAGAQCGAACHENIQVSLAAPIFYMMQFDASLVLSKKVTLIGKNLPASILLPKANFVAIDSHVFVLVHL